MNRSKVGIDNYSLFPLKLDPLNLLQWCLDHGGDGVAFSGLDEESQKKINTSYLKDMLQFARDNDLYLEWGGGQHIPRDMKTWEKKEIFELH